MFPGSMISSIMYPSLLIRLNNLLIFSCLQFSAACLLRESRRKPTKRHCRAHVMFHFSIKSLVRLDRRGSSWNTRIPWRTHPTGLKTLRCYFCLRAENRCSSSCSKNRYSHSRKRLRHSYSNCCSTAAPHGSHVCLYLLFFVSFYKEAGFAARLCPFRTPATGGRSRPPRFHAPTELRNDVITPEGEPRTVARARARRIVTRKRVSDPATRSRTDARPQHHTGAG